MGKAFTEIQRNVTNPQVNYALWRKMCGGYNSPIGSIKDHCEIAIIGAGFGGVLAALLLAKCGAKVTVYEWKDQAGGAVKCLSFPDGTKVSVGPMRFPSNDPILREVAEFCGYELVSGFPNPGVATTMITFNRHSYIWREGAEIPSPFKVVMDGYNALLVEGLKPLDKNGTALKSWHYMTGCLEEDCPGGAAKIVEARQGWIDAFDSHTLQQAFREIFHESSKKWQVPGGVHWTDEDFTKFDTIGFGIGGYGTLRHHSFLSFLDEVVNGYDADLGMLVKSTDDGSKKVAPAGDLLADLVTRAEEAGAKFKFGHQVVECSSSSPDEIELQLCVKQDNGTELQQNVTANAVMSTTTFKALQTIRGVERLLPAATWKDICEIGASNATKAFALLDLDRVPETKTKDFPKVFVSDRFRGSIYLDIDKQAHGKVPLMFVYAFGKDCEIVDQFTAEELWNASSHTIEVATKGLDCHDAWMRLLDTRIGELVIHKWSEDPTSLCAFPYPKPGDEERISKLSYDWARILNSGAVPFFVGGAFGCCGWLLPTILKSFEIVVAILEKYGIVFHQEHAPTSVRTSPYRFDSRI